MVGRWAVVVAWVGVASCKGGAGGAGSDADAGGAGRADASASAGVAVSGRPAGEVDAGFVTAAAALEGAGTDAGSTRGLSDPPAAGTMIDMEPGELASGSTTPGDTGATRRPSRLSCG